MNLDMTDRVCPLCGQSGQGRVHAEANADLKDLNAFSFASRKLPEYMHWRLVECQKCDVLYSSPVPTIDYLSAAYDQAAFDSGDEARYAAQTYAGFLPRIKANIPDLDGALDIGTGDGVFLHELLKAGFTSVAGVEPSTAPIAAARGEVRPLIRHEMFNPEAFAPESFSLITCFQTIEHLSDPLAMCRNAFGLLKPGGALFLIGHNRRAMSAKLLGKRSPIFDIEHLQLFSRNSARVMVERAGFDNVEVGAFVNRYPLVYWMRLLPVPVSVKRQAIRLATAMRVGRIALSLPVGNLAIQAYKPR
jgi:SAM-dependent methyltransferase